MGKVKHMIAPTERPRLDLRDILHERRVGTIKTTAAADSLTERIALFRESHPHLVDQKLKTLSVWANVFASEVRSHIQVPEHKSYESEFDFICQELEKWGHTPGPDGKAICDVLVR
mgnify:CR=1 FL=1